MTLLPGQRAPARSRPVLGRLHRARHRGQALVEFALIVPVLFFLLVIAIDFGRLFFSYIQINNAAREGAAYAMYKPTDLATITSRAEQETNAQGQAGENAIAVTTACADQSGTSIACSLATGGPGPGNRIAVNVSEAFTFLTPMISGLFGGDLQMDASATSVVTDYAPSSGGVPPGPCALPVASFTVVITSGLSVLADPSASTPGSGVCSISGYNWTWGDPSDPDNEEPGEATSKDHTYLAAGTYTIELEVTNQAGSDSAAQLVTVPEAPPPTCTAPTANFTFTTSGNGSNKTWTYSDTTTVADPVNCPITAWLWTFTDQGGLQSNAQFPAPVKYGGNPNALHSVTLTVTNDGGSDTITKSTP
ncbi:MAG: TadE/TadG family type IV pilus assembly protein [Candidatus Limnocylindrales bacterium]|nr:TadE/TadG family type IV pilus assembly protein [Candidatus Limnocylindrales bacterium]